MRRWIHIGAVVFCVVLSACSGDKPKELLETAQLEERQHNVVHAKQLYETSSSPGLVILWPLPHTHFFSSNCGKVPLSRSPIPPLMRHGDEEQSCYASSRHLRRKGD